MVIDYNVMYKSTPQQNGILFLHTKYYSLDY